MSEIHIGPHTRGEGPHGHGHGGHGHGEPHHTYDREIDLKSIGKWIGGLVVLAVIIQILMWWLLRGLENFDERSDPELLPIQQETRVNEQVPPEPRLQLAPGFEKINPGAIARSDVEDMQNLREREDKVLGAPSWIERGQGRVRVPIDVAMEVIASRGVPDVVGGAAGTVTPEEMRQQLPAGTSTGAPGATMQMTRPQTPAQPPAADAQPAGAAPGAATPSDQQPAQRPPASQEQ